MDLSPHQQRVIEEKVELDAKLVKIRAFFGTPLFSILKEPEQDRLHRQAGYMSCYSAVLDERIAAFAEKVKP